jgi:hypothetical protein
MMPLSHPADLTQVLVRHLGFSDGQFNRQT